MTLHLPPASPPLLILALLPGKMTTSTTAAAAAAASASTTATSATSAAKALIDATSKTPPIPPTITTITNNLLVSNLARKMALASLSVAVLSMADHNFKRTKRLIKLPLEKKYADIQRAKLPPFLPDFLVEMEDVDMDGDVDVDIDVDIEEDETFDSFGIEENNLDNGMSHNEDYNDISGSGHGSNNDNSMNNNNKIPTEYSNLPTTNQQKATTTTTTTNNSNSKNKKNIIKMQAKWKHITNQIKTQTPKPPQSITSKLAMRQRMKLIQKREYEILRRNKIRDELVLLQDLKRQQLLASLANKDKRTTTNKVGKNRLRKPISSSRKDIETMNASPLLSSQQPPLGYALITGASKGIGRAIAVECARWGIPLILVARDLQRLERLADDIEACYGVDCKILQADLGVGGMAKRIHMATCDAGLNVDLLVNNGETESFIFIFM